MLVKVQEQRTQKSERLAEVLAAIQTEQFMKCKEKGSRTLKFSVLYSSVQAVSLKQFVFQNLHLHG